MENFVNFQEMLQLEISPMTGFLENSGYSRNTTWITNLSENINVWNKLREQIHG